MCFLGGVKWCLERANDARMVLPWILKLLKHYVELLHKDLKLSGVFGWI